MHYGQSATFAYGNSPGDSCAVTVQNGVRGQSSLFTSILLQGMLEFRRAAGPAWSGYEGMLDLIDGVSSHALTELFADDGSGNWQVNHAINGIALDHPSNCLFYYNNKDYIGSTVYLPFYAQAVVGRYGWESKFQTILRKTMATYGVYAIPETGSYQTQMVIDTLVRRRPVLTTVPLAGFVENGGGSYTLSWVVPAKAQSYRIKWSTSRIVDWIGFSAATNTWIGNPATTMNWFAATNVSNEPAPQPAGTTQSLTLTGLPPGLPADHFMLKALIQ